MAQTEQQQAQAQAMAMAQAQAKPENPIDSLVQELGKAAAGPEEDPVKKAFPTIEPGAAAYVSRYYWRWSEVFTTTDKSPVGTRFLNADGKSVHDILSDDGTTILDFYQGGGDIEQYLSSRGMSLSDFKWDSPFGVITVHETIAKVNAGEIEIPAGGGKHYWDVERVLCRKGNTMAEILFSWGAVAFDRKARGSFISREAAILSFLLGSAGIVLGYAAYYASSGGENLTKSEIEVIQEDSDNVISSSLKAGLPKWEDSFPVNANDVPAYKLGLEYSQKNLSGFGAGVSGNYWPSIEPYISSSASQHGIDKKKALENYIKYTQGGITVSNESCEKIKETGSFTGIGGQYSPVLYSYAITQDEAAEALGVMANSWLKSGKIDLPENGFIAGSAGQMMSHVGATGDNGQYMPCAGSAIMAYQPKIGQYEAAAPYLLVSIAIRSPLEIGNATVASKLFIFATSTTGENLRIVRELKSSGSNDSIDNALRTGAPVAYESSVDESYACKKVDGGDELSLDEEIAYYNAMKKSTPSEFIATSDVFSMWQEDGIFPKGVPIVSLDEFMQSRRKGDCYASPVVAYALNSKSTKYMISSIRVSTSGFERSLLFAYDTGSDRGIRVLSCSECPSSSEGVSVKNALLTASDFSNALIDGGYAAPEQTDNNSDRKALMLALGISDEDDYIKKIEYLNGAIVDSFKLKASASADFANLDIRAIIDTLKENNFFDGGSVEVEALSKAFDRSMAIYRATGAYRDFEVAMPTSKLHGVYEIKAETAADLVVNAMKNHNIAVDDLQKTMIINSIIDSLPNPKGVEDFSAEPILYALAQGNARSGLAAASKTHEFMSKIDESDFKAMAASVFSANKDAEKFAAELYDNARKQDAEGK